MGVVGEARSGKRRTVWEEEEGEGDEDGG